MSKRIEFEANPERGEYVSGVDGSVGWSLRELENYGEGREVLIEPGNAALSREKLIFITGLSNCYLTVEESKALVRALMKAIVQQQKINAGEPL